MKKILIIGAIALMVVGCVLVAGCTSTTNNGANPESGQVITIEENSGDVARFYKDAFKIKEESGLSIEEIAIQEGWVPYVPEEDQAKYEMLLDTPVPTFEA